MNGNTCWQPAEAERQGTGSPPEPPGARPLDTLNVGFWETMRFCYKQPSLWQFLRLPRNTHLYLSDKVKLQGRDSLHIYIVCRFYNNHLFLHG
uniref:Alternative protein LOC729444 n=1 Tax=Homo sapiens TaxID=9606 RepID=L8EBI3_HUMAN|nr:alternative protein LOC729444 [Homo sapiens]